MKNKVVLITGGTGSFGKSFVKYALSKKPKKLIIYSRDELKQFEIKKNFNKSELKILRFFIGDVREYDRLLYALQNVDYVVHAAALKQIDTCEYNPFEAIKTNVLGAQNLINASLSSGVKKVIALSTDKASSPINLYGATKLASDKLFIAANYHKGSTGGKFSVVRYGNVLNSRGSVIPLFLKMNSTDTKKIPITDINMTRFWISLDEAVEFVFSCLQIMDGGEIFVPKIKSVKTIDLAKIICKNKKIELVGIRPGEKIHEVMCPVENSNQTFEYKEKFIIFPDYEKKFNLKNKGKKVKSDFEYSSDNKKFIMSLNEITNKLKEEKII